jgi:hypothetical protein
MKRSVVLSLVGVAAIMLVVGTTLGSVMFPMTKIETTTLLSFFTSTTTFTVTTEARLYNLTFIETSETPCNPSYLAEWSVTLGNETKAQPFNATLPIPDNQWNAGTDYANLSTITFFVASGTYSYTIHPSSGLTPNSGVVIVNGLNVIIQVFLPSFPCTTSTPQTSNATTITSANSNQTCTAAATVTQNNTTQVLTLCHTESYTSFSTNSSSVSSRISTNS